MFGKIVSKLFGFTFLAVILSFLALMGYFWHKSGQPIQVDEAQQIAPGITFQEFREDRIKQWAKWDDELRDAGKNGACVSIDGFFWATSATIGIKDVIYMQGIHNDADALLAFQKANNGIILPDQYLTGSWLTFPDAYWWYIENSYWYQFSNAPGFPVKELGQRRACSTTLPKKP